MTTKKAPEKTIFGTSLSLHKHKISQSELARRSGIDVCNINQYISGRQTAKIPTLLKICKTLQVEPNKLQCPSNLFGSTLYIRNRAKDFCPARFLLKILYDAETKEGKATQAELLHIIKVGGFTPYIKKLEGKK